MRLSERKDKPGIWNIYQYFTYQRVFNQDIFDKWIHGDGFHFYILDHDCWRTERNAVYRI